MPTDDPIHPIKDVWLRPRRVFRELAARPVGPVDYSLAAAQGAGNFLALSRTQDAGAHQGLMQIFATSLTYGSVAGIVSVFLMAAIYNRLSARAGGKLVPRQMIHVLTYGGVPMVAALGLWLLTALLAGDAAFVQTPPADTEGFVLLLLQLQVATYLLLALWSMVLLVMGISEVQGFSMRKAFGVWLLGQLAALLVCMVLALLAQAFFPGLIAGLAPPH